MAGYFLYSLDWPKFRHLVERPTKTQLTVLSKALAAQLKIERGRLAENDPARAWPADAGRLVAVVADRLSRADWYGDLSDRRKDIWEFAFTDACRARRLGVGFRVDGNDSVYWDVAGFVRERLTSPDAAMARFGTGAFRFTQAEPDPSAIHPLTGLPGYAWTPTHSMHPPDEVKRMATELRSLAAAVETEADKSVRLQFQGELLPTVEKVAKGGRLLFVQVST